MPHRMGGADTGRHLGSALVTANQSTTSTTLADVTGTSVTVTTDGGSIVIDWGAWVSINPTAAGTGISIALLEDGTIVDTMRFDGHVAALNINGNLFKSTLRTPAAGSHTYKMQLKVTAAGTGVVTAASSAPAGIVSIRTV